MCRSTPPLFKTAILPNIWLKWLPWQLHIGLIYGEIYLPLPFYNIYHRKSHLMCMCRSTTPLFKPAILPNIWLQWLPWQLYIGLILWENVSPSPISTKKYLS